MATYSYNGNGSGNGTAQFVTVQTTGTYDIVGYGGRGGNSSNYVTTGGGGAEAGGDFRLTAGEKLKIVVGGQGGDFAYGGGGGGTFVFGEAAGASSYTLLLAAGGGGGAYRGNGGAGSATAAPGNGAGGTASSNDGGGGGAGIKGAGASAGSATFGGRGGSSGPSYAGGAAARIGSGKGGFGGGGSAGFGGGGGGGGYTGGAGGYRNPGNGTGGTSFLGTLADGTRTVRVDGQNTTGAGRVLITPNVTCFAAGTAILVLRDGVATDVAVEDLAVGDVAITASGARRAIRWLGSREVDCAGFDDPRRARPIRIAANAFSEGRPARTLRVSPDHALAVRSADGEEILVPAFAFLNGATVTQDQDNTVTYWHVELDGGHDILLAEGLAAESYLDCGNRGFFTGEDGVMDAGLDARGSCRRRSNDADTLRLARAALRAQAIALGWRLDADPLGGLRLIADGVPVLPDSDGLAARFLLPAAARDVWLVSAASVPWDVSDTADGRRLGLCLGALALGDGLSMQHDIALDDPRLADGFHPPEPGCRWTDGRARLDPELWAGCRGHLFLRVALACPCLPGWRAPKVDGADLRVA